MGTRRAIDMGEACRYGRECLLDLGALTRGVPRIPVHSARTESSTPAGPRIVSVGGAKVKQGADSGDQLGRLHRLGHMHLETREQGALPIVRPRVGRKRNRRKVA